MAANSSTLSPNSLVHRPSNYIRMIKVPFLLPRGAFYSYVPAQSNRSMFYSRSIRKSTAIFAVTAKEPAITSSEPEEERRLFVGNIPRSVNNEELANIFGEHGSVEKAEVMYHKRFGKIGKSRRFAFVTMATVDDANAAIENLNEKEIGGEKVKVNIIEKPYVPIDLSQVEAEESKFIDSPYIAFVGGLAKTVTNEQLTNYFSEKGKMLSAKIARVPGTLRSSGVGYVSFSSEEDMQAAFINYDKAWFFGKKIRVNRA